MPEPLRPASLPWTPRLPPADRKSATEFFTTCGRPRSAHNLITEIWTHV